MGDLLEWKRPRVRPWKNSDTIWRGAERKPFFIHGHTLLGDDKNIMECTRRTDWRLGVDWQGGLSALEISAHYENVDNCLIDLGYDLNDSRFDLSDPKDILLHKARAAGDVFYSVHVDDYNLAFANRIQMDDFIFGFLFPEDSTLEVVSKVGVLKTGYIWRKYLPASVVGLRCINLQAAARAMNIFKNIWPERKSQKSEWAIFYDKHVVTSVSNWLNVSDTKRLTSLPRGASNSTPLPWTLSRNPDVSYVKARKSPTTASYISLPQL